MAYPVPDIQPAWYHILNNRSVGSHQTPVVEGRCDRTLTAIHLGFRLRYQHGVVLALLGLVEAPSQRRRLDQEVIDKELPADVDGDNLWRGVQVGYANRLPSPSYTSRGGHR